MIKCNRCGNTKNFAEIHVGGSRKHEWTQASNGRMIYEKANYDKVDDTSFECGKCGSSMNEQYRRFLQALFEPYNDKKHGN
jgi:ribosomal protein S27AE